LRKRLRRRPPIATTYPRDELTAFGKSGNFDPGWLLAKCEGEKNTRRGG